MRKKSVIIIPLIIFIIIVLLVFVSYDRLKIDLKNLINNKYESITLDGIYITDSDELLIDLYIEDEKKCIGDSFEIRNMVKDYLKNHNEYNNMRVEICFRSYSQDFSIIFTNYSEDFTDIKFENSYDINIGLFSCAYRLSLFDFKGVEGIEDFEILRFAYLNDYHDVSALDSIKNLELLDFTDYSKLITDYDYLIKKHPNCKIVINDSESFEQTDKLEPYNVIIEEVSNEKK